MALPPGSSSPDDYGEALAKRLLVYLPSSALTVGFEQNDWDDDIDDYDDMVISGTSGTLTAGLEVTF